MHIIIKTGTKSKGLRITIVIMHKNKIKNKIKRREREEAPHGFFIKLFGSWKNMDDADAY